MADEKYYNIQDNLPDQIQEAVGPFIDIPHPSPIQIAQDVFSILRTLPNRQLEFAVEKKNSYNIATRPPELQDDTPVMTSKLNTPVLDKLELKVPSGEVEFIQASNVEDNGTFVYLRYEDVLITVSQAKKIVTTEIAGNDGSVKELVGLGDYDITINGRLTATYGKRPFDDLMNLQRALNINKKIDTACLYLNNLNITTIVVTGYDLPQVEGEYSTQYFTINAQSDFQPENDFIKFTGL